MTPFNHCCEFMRITLEDKDYPKKDGPKVKYQNGKYFIEYELFSRWGKNGTDRMYMFHCIYCGAKFEETCNRKIEEVHQ